jgi:hypothetical protein
MTQLSEFYLHNFVLLHPYRWSPNPYVGEVQVKDLCSWIHHGEITVFEFQNNRKEEMGSHPWIRVEDIREKELINNHISLTLDIELISILEEKRRWKIAHFEDGVRI